MSGIEAKPWCELGEEYCLGGGRWLGTIVWVDRQPKGPAGLPATAKERQAMIMFKDATEGEARIEDNRSVIVSADQLAIHGINAAKGRIIDWRCGEGTGCEITPQVQAVQAPSETPVTLLPSRYGVITSSGV